jgi:hypothetical protein
VSDFTDFNPIGSLVQGLSQGIQEKQKNAYLKELEEREKLAKRFDEIYSDAKNWDTESRSKAFNYANQLRMLPPDKRRPKEFLPDKEGRIQALVDVTYRKAMKDGLEAPKEPPQPADPSKGLSGPPDPMAMIAGAAGGAGGAGGAGVSAPPTAAGLSMPPLQMGGEMDVASGGVPPTPGGEQVGPNAVRPAPAVPAAPAAGMAPPPDPAMAADPMADMVSAMRTPQQIAQEEADMLRIKNEINVPGHGAVDSRGLSLIKADQDTETRLLLKGYDRNGNPIPLEKLPPEMRANIELTKSKEELVEAQAALALAKAKAVPAEIAIAQRRVEVAADRATVASGGTYSYTVLKDPTGQITGVWARNSKNPEDQQVFGAPDGALGARTTEVSRPEREMYAMQVMSIKDIDDMTASIPRVQKYVGAFAGRTVEQVMKIQDLDPEIHKFFILAKTLTADRIKQISGAAVSEQEAQRLGAILPDPKQTPSRIMAELQVLKSHLDAYARANAMDPRNTAKPAGRQPAGKGNTNASVPPPPNPDLPPPEKRVAGQTTAVIGGVKRVWTGSGWAIAK